MARRGEPSTAHEYNSREECIHCGMYRNNVEAISHVCKPMRELIVDSKAAAEAGVNLEDYRQNGR